VHEEADADHRQDDQTEGQFKDCRSILQRLAVEAGASQGWRRYVGDRDDVLGVDRYGASAPGNLVMREYGFTVDNVCRRAMAVFG
jgi:transketolase